MSSEKNHKPEYDLINRDVPVKGVLKYIVAERDKHKARAESVANYARCLEAQVASKDKRIAELEAELAKFDETKAERKARSKREATLKKHLKGMLGKLKLDTDYITKLIEFLNDGK